MAQAALVRGQAQAQAAMMLNPRNLQVMAEQMGLRQPFNPNKQNRKQGSNASTPTALSPDDPGNFSFCLEIVTFQHGCWLQLIDNFMWFCKILIYFFERFLQNFKVLYPFV